MEGSQETSRFKLWSILLVFNVIILLSVSSIDVPEAQVSRQGWAIGLSIISLLLTSIITYAYFHDGLRSIILNTKIELYTILNTLILRVAIVALISSPTNGLAVEDDGAVYLANLYYFSWAAFGNVVILLASFVENMYGISVRSAFQSVETSTSGEDYDTSISEQQQTQSSSNDNNVKTPSMAFIYWFSLMTTSIIVMATAGDIYNRNCEVEINLKPQPFCSRTTFTIITGTMATISCLLIVIAKLTYYQTPFLLEVLLCLLLFILYIFELIYATRADGPGSPLGNLYYFSWFSFLLCFGIGKCCYDDYVYALNVAEAEFQGERNRRRTNVPSLQRYDDDDVDDDDGVQEQYHNGTTHDKSNEPDVDI